MATRKRRVRRKASEVSDVRSSNPSVRGKEGSPNRSSKSGYYVPTKDGFGNPYKPRRKKRQLASIASDVRSDSGYEIESGKADAGGVNPRLQGPWRNRYRAAQKARRRRKGHRAA